jgi:hypothetical protein
MNPPSITTLLALVFVLASEIALGLLQSGS